MALAVLFVVPRFHTNLFFATCALVEAGHRAVVIAAGSARLEDHSVVAPWIVAPGNDPSELDRLMREAAPDLAFLRTDAAGLGQSAGRICRRRQIPAFTYTQWPMSTPPGLRRRLRLWRDGMPWRRVTPVPGRDRAAPRDRWARYLPWPVAPISPTPEAAPRMGRSGVVLRVLCVGKLFQPRKQQDLLISAMSDGIADGRMTLTLAGSASQDPKISGADPRHFARLRQAADTWPGGIHIRPDVPFGEMPALYASHDVCVLPARGEPLGTAPIEAMAYGCVPVISAGCGSAGYLTDGENGFVVDADPAAFADVLNRLAGKRALLARIGGAARRLAETELSPGRFVDRIEALATGGRAGD